MERQATLYSQETQFRIGGILADVTGIEQAAERFARTWEAGWAAHDSTEIAELYAADCIHRSMPFRPVHPGRKGVVEYVDWAFSTERATGVRFGPPLVAGDWATIEYWATMVTQDGGNPVTIAGCVIVRFRPDGLVAESRDYWHVADGHRHPEGALFMSAT
jgi:SnoaL-like domain